MKTLSLETSHRPGTLAIGSDENRETIELPSEAKTAEVFATHLAGLLTKAGWLPTDIDLVAVTDGPGSFTGLRIGVTAAKSFAYAAEAEIIALATDLVIAGQSPNHEHLTVVIDAQRGEMFCSTFDTTGTTPQRLSEARIVSKDESLAIANGAPMTGPGLLFYRGDLPDGANATDEATWMPNASTLLELAELAYGAGQRNNLWKLAPKYIRKSAAEEKRREIQR